MILCKLVNFAKCMYTLTFLDYRIILYIAWYLHWSNSRPNNTSASCHPVTWQTHVWTAVHTVSSTQELRWLQKLIQVLCCPHRHLNQSSLSGFTVSATSISTWSEAACAGKLQQLMDYMQILPFLLHLQQFVIQPVMHPQPFLMSAILVCTSEMLSSLTQSIWSVSVSICFHLC